MVVVYAASTITHTQCCDMNDFREVMEHWSGLWSMYCCRYDAKMEKVQQVRGTFMLTPAWTYDWGSCSCSSRTKANTYKKFFVGIVIWKVMRSLLLQKSALWRNLNTRFSSEWEEVISQQVTLSVNVFMALLLLFILLNPRFCHSSHWKNKVVPWGLFNFPEMNLFLGVKCKAWATR